MVCLYFITLLFSVAGSRVTYDSYMENKIVTGHVVPSIIVKICGMFQNSRSTSKGRQKDT